MTSYTIENDKIKINGKLTYSEYKECPKEYQGLLMNARFIQGIFDDKMDVSRFNRFDRVFDANKNTDDLIKALPMWYEKGLRAITVGFQGGGPCFTIDNETIENNAFSKDGRSMDKQYLERMKRIILAADKIGMLVIVSYFYPEQTRFLENDDAVIQAVKVASNWLRDEGFTNVIIEVANEQNVKQYRLHPIICTEKGIVDLIRIAKRESGNMAVGSSRAGLVFSEEVSQASDIILIHGNGMSRQQFYMYVNKAKEITPKRPIVCNEDSQSLTNMQVALDQGISWGYYNNMTKQEPPTDWTITKGEDFFFASRLAESLGIEKSNIAQEDQFYLQGLESNMVYENKRWIRLASLYPEKIQRVDFYRNDEYFRSAYNSPFTINFISNWMQKPVIGIEKAEKWKAVILLVDGTVIEKEKIVGED